MPTNAPFNATVKVVFNHLPAMSSGLHSGAVAIIKTSAFDIEAAAKTRVPVRTGTLRRSIHTLIEAGGLRAIVGPSVSYSVFVEFGTRSMAARPYMRPAAELVFPKFKAAIIALCKAA